MTSKEDLVLMLEDIHKRSDKLSDWEIGFVDSMKRTIGNGALLTTNQDKMFSAIWDRVTR